jgi:hypothetical protein
MDVTYLELDGLDIRTGDLTFWVRNFMDMDNDVITNDLFSPGVSFNRKKRKERKFVLNGFIRNNVNQNWMALSTIVNKPGPLTLVIGMAGLPTKRLEIVVESVAYSEPDADEVSLSVIAPDPKLYANVLQSITLGSVSESGLAYPITYPITYGVPSGGYGVITNEGNISGYPKFTIIGSCSNLTLSNATTGETMMFNVSLAEGDTLVVDCQDREVLLNGVRRIDLKSGEWISCVPGMNEIGFSRSSLEQKQHCSVEFRSVWMT